jgi:hypothetical protein
MKKIISLLATIAMMATMVTSVSAAEIDNNAPVTETVITEITAEEFESDWVGEALPEGQKAYLVEATATGLDLSVVRAGSTAAAKKKRTGVLLMMAEYELIFDSVDNVAAVYGVDGIAGFTSEPKKAYAIALGTNTITGAYPTTTDTATTAVTAEDAYVTAFVVTTTGPVNGTVKASYKVSSFDSDSQTGTKDFNNELGNVAYTVNGEAGKAVTLGAAGGEDEEKVTEVVTSDKIDLEAANGVKGAAWDVTIKNFDSEKAYMATFTNLDNGEVRRGYSDEIDVSKFAETTGDVSFAVIMKLLTVTNVGLDIAIQ